MKKIIALALIALLSLVACSGPQVKEGTVVDKRYSPAWEQWMPGSWEESCTGFGAERRCTSWYKPGYTIYHPADYDLQIAGTIVVEDEKQKKVEQWVDVSNGLYESCRVGDWWAADQGCSRGNR